MGYGAHRYGQEKHLLVIWVLVIIDTDRRSTCLLYGFWCSQIRTGEVPANYIGFGALRHGQEKHLLVIWVLVLMDTDRSNTC